MNFFSRLEPPGVPHIRSQAGGLNVAATKFSDCGPFPWVYEPVQQTSDRDPLRGSPLWPSTWPLASVLPLGD